MAPVPRPIPTRRWTALLLALLLVPVAVRAEDPREGSHRGWAYLIDKLVADGIDRKRVTLVFDDPRMPPFDGLSFSLAPRESHALYRNFQRPASIAAARRCRTEHAAVFDAAERASGVSASVVAAILYVETGCGRNTGSSMVLHRLARLAMANEPDNLRDNVDRLSGEGDAEPAVEEQVRARARYLEDTFYPEVRAVFEVADRMSVHPLALRGSPSGAIGLPQFLPTSYLRFGADADRDGQVDLFDVDDAAASCAQYLAGHGWRADLSEKERRSVVWRYNRSDAYIDAVLALARHIDRGHAPAPSKRSSARTGRKAGTRTAPKRS